MRKYEVMFIVRPDVSEEEAEKIIAQMEGSVTATRGKIEKVEKMGRRKLAYRVSGYREGLYVLFTLEGSGETVKEFERRLKVSDTVLKFLTVRIDEELERLEKWKALRAKQAARKSKSAAAPAAPAADVQPILAKE